MSTKTAKKSDRLSLDVDWARMPHTTQFHYYRMGVSDLYYALLFATSDGYGKDVWKTWVDMGFATGLREGPPGATADDRIHLSMQTLGKRFSVNVTGGRADVLGRLLEVLQQIDKLRPSLRDDDDAKRADRVLAEAGLANGVWEPIAAAVKKSGLVKADAEKLMTALRRGASALTDPGILKVTSG